MVLQCIFAIIVLGNSNYIFTIKKKKKDTWKIDLKKLDIILQM